MNKSILLAVFGCITQWATASDADILALLNHQPGAELTSMELMYLGNIFDEMDTNNDGILEEADFERYMVNDISHSTEAVFNLLDTNNDYQIDYNELVYYFKQAWTDFPGILTTEEENEIELAYLELNTGKAYTDFTRSELMAAAMIHIVDTSQNGYINLDEYNKWRANAEWNAVRSSESVTQINFDQFKTGFFASPLFQAYKESAGLTSQQQQQYNSFITHLNDASNNHEFVLGEIDNDLEFTVTYFDSSFDDWNLVEESEWYYLDYYYYTDSDSGFRRRLGKWKGFFKGVSHFADLITIGSAAGSASGCYDDYNMVNTLNKGNIYIKDLSVGDYVHDGNDYTKVYFVQRFDKHDNVNMLDIKYGNPEDENSITLTPHHLLYYADGKAPVISGDIKIGDRLYGDSNANNYTVYEIKNVYNRHPVNPITASGNLMVNNIKTSVFTKSAAEHERLTECGKIFAWISDNISQDLAANLVDFYWNVVYARIIRQNYYIHQLFVLNATFATMIILSVPALIIMILFKSSNPIKKLDDINVC